MNRYMVATTFAIHKDRWVASVMPSDFYDDLDDAIAQARASAKVKDPLGVETKVYALVEVPQYDDPEMAHYVGGVCRGLEKHLGIWAGTKLEPPELS